jgi:hypothetical protein
LGPNHPILGRREGRAIGIGHHEPNEFALIAWPPQLEMRDRIGNWKEQRTAVMMGRRESGKGTFGMSKSEYIHGILIECKFGTPAEENYLAIL